jgi:hypothetical protein
MAGSFEFGALLGHVYTLKDGTCARLRLARSSDAPAIARLLEGHAPVPHELDVRRLVHFDPRRRQVLCATGLVQSRETLLGIGAITLDAESPEPDLLIVVEPYRDELSPLLTRALGEAAGAIRRSRAA